MISAVFVGKLLLRQVEKQRKMIACVFVGHALTERGRSHLLHVALNVIFWMHGKNCSPSFNSFLYLIFDLIESTEIMRGNTQRWKETR